MPGHAQFSITPRLLVLKCMSLFTLALLAHQRICVRHSFVLVFVFSILFVESVCLFLAVIRLADGVTG